MGLLPYHWAVPFSWRGASRYLGMKAPYNINVFCTGTVYILVLGWTLNMVRQDVVSGSGKDASLISFIYTIKKEGDTTSSQAITKSVNVCG